jgi:hypothetical protein
MGAQNTIGYSSTSTYLKHYIWKIDGKLYHSKYMPTKLSPDEGEPVEEDFNEILPHYSITLGFENIITTPATVAIGNYNKADGDFDSSWMIGEGLKVTKGREISLGTYNDSTESSIFTIGNGKTDTDRSNAFKIDKDGTVYIMKDGKLVSLQELLGVQVSAII